MFAIDTKNGIKEARRIKPEPSNRGQRQPDREASLGRGAEAGTTGPAPLTQALSDPIGYAIGFVRRRILSILVFGLLGLAVGAGMGWLTHNRYTASTQLLIDPRDLRVLQNEISPQAIGNDSIIAYLESQVRVIASDSIKRKVIAKLDLDKDPDFGGQRSSLAGRFGFGGAARGPVQDPVLVALAAMDKQVLIRRGDRTFVIDITVISGDGEKSARVANAMAETYLEDQTAVRAESAQRASNSLGGRLNELRERVRASEEKVENYRASRNLVGAGGKLVTDEQLAASNAQLTQARARTGDAQAKFDQVRAVRPTSIEAGATPEALQSSAIATLRGQLGSALTREADALVLYGAQHPQLISAQAQVRDARRQIAEELARTVQAARAELDRARAAETALSAQVDRLKREALNTGQANVQLRELEREADAHRQVYQAFLLRARETGEQTSVDTTNARIITEAVAPLEKNGPNRKLFAAIGLIVGLGAGLAFALLLDLIAQRRHRLAADAGGWSAPAAWQEAARAETPDRQAQAQPAPGRSASGRPAPEASTSAQSAAAAGPTARAGKWRGLAAVPSAGQPAAAAEGPLVVKLPAVKRRGWARGGPSAFHGAAFATDAWDDAASPLGGAIAQIRDRLALLEVPGKNRKVLALGLAPGAGASLVALNLALASAREKATPLLIDLAHGPLTLSASFAPDAPLGAEEVIEGAAGLIRAALQDDETGSFFLPRSPAATRRPTPCRDSLSDRLFEQTRRFDAVIIDAGSIADGALPHLLAEMADDVIMVAPAGMGADAALKLAARALGPEAGKARCLVLNAGAAA
jgi:uncharacterized protein involved in exopolysaccharide biosynthesis/Mrp family chromosome partitioning ATPase